MELVSFSRCTEKNPAREGVQEEKNNSEKKKKKSLILSSWGTEVYKSRRVLTPIISTVVLRAWHRHGLSPVYYCYYNSIITEYNDLGPMITEVTWYATWLRERSYAARNSPVHERRDAMIFLHGEAEPTTRPRPPRLPRPALTGRCAEEHGPGCARSQ